MGICFSCPKTSTVTVVERCGEYQRLNNAGCNFVACCVGEYVAGTVSLRLQQIDVRVESKTSDNVFVELVVSVQFKVDDNQTYNFFYTLSDVRRQLTSFIFDTVRSDIPKLSLDDVFAQKETIAANVKDSLATSMKGFGIVIERSLITEVTPDANVKAAMNSINAASRERIAAQDKAEAAKIKEVKAAEAEAEGKYLQGTGIARQRQAIIGGLQESVSSFAGETDLQAKDTLSILICTQWLDTMKEIGTSNNSKTIFVPHSPASATETTDSIRTGILQGSEAKSHP